jgi:Rv0078B-related antitoxin
VQPSAVAERFQLAMELCELAEDMLRAKLRRKHPGSSAEEIEAMVDAWFMTRPGAEEGDAEGRPVPWPRSR